ncbi:head-tail adaptor protein [Streptomonospora litoralis]|uniref:Uncharacterized protein n=1 Tax=Streptomonospora litoralis TaxID=2498135 RepID=A0A4P6QAL8_9ACTN|nr:head-tail adaptor protein [Streptomonospora litoralis]QBI56801.1 hypothetical protein EKD16_25300 [Streptomonospora litoralis]
MVAHLLDLTLDHYRVETVRTPSGGLSEDRVHLGKVDVRPSQPSAQERALARTAVGPQQGQAELTQPVYVEADEDVRRGDELEDPVTGVVRRVVARLRPSEEDAYLRLDVEVHQPEPTVEEVS